MLLLGVIMLTSYILFMVKFYDSIAAEALEFNTLFYILPISAVLLVFTSIIMIGVYNGLAKKAYALSPLFIEFNKKIQEERIGQSIFDPYNLFNPALFGFCILLSLPGLVSSMLVLLLSGVHNWEASKAKNGLIVYSTRYIAWISVMIGSIISIVVSVALLLFPILLKTNIDKTGMTVYIIMICMGVVALILCLLNMIVSGKYQKKR